MNVSTPRLTALVQQLRHYSQRDIQTRWRWHPGPHTVDTAMAEGHRWPLAPLNDRHHVAWQRGTTRWLYQRCQVPETLEGYPLTGLTLRLATAWWAEDAQVFVNGELAQSGDLFDFWIHLCLEKAVTPGQEFTLVLRLEAPKHDDGALVRSRLIYEATDHPVSPEPGFVADELQVVQHYLEALAPEKLTSFETEAETAWAQSSGPIHQRLAQLRQRLSPYGAWAKQRRIHCVGHAHLDLAWLWPVADTWQAAERTFTSVLSLQQEFPELTYTHSSPALFAWLEANRPQLFAQIQQQVAAGAWSIDAGLWVEPELNIVSGESIARQILCGQRYCREKFGAPSAIAWLPDTFGFCPQLPQLLRLGGVEVFATQKLRWNDTTQFPHELFHWQAPDGSQVLGWTLPPIGTDFDPAAMAAYGASWEAATQSPIACWLPGVGDHGGGPTREMLLKFRRWQRSPFFPEVRFSSPADFLAETMAPLAAEQLPQWRDELYLELHRGCYTTRSDQKQQNRSGEDLLYQAELWATLAHLVQGAPYPAADLKTAWHALLFNQFHDILPGSSIPEVFQDANRDWVEFRQRVAPVIEQSVAALIPPVEPGPGQTAVVFNALGQERQEIVTLALPPGSWQVIDSATGQPLESFTEKLVNPLRPETANQVTGFRAALPSVGYSCYDIVPKEPSPAVSSEAALPTDYCLENSQLKIVVSPENGEILSCFHKASQREFLSPAGTCLSSFQDGGQYWDAWNIAPDYEQNPQAPAQLTGLTWITRQPLRQRLRVSRQLNQSRIVQDYVLDQDSPLLQVETWVDWRESQQVLKVGFPLAFASDNYVCEAPFGITARPTQPATDQEKAKWEVPMLRWASLDNGDQGMAILTSGKHGLDVKPNQLRLTLLKAPLWPDPDCDRGYHRFTYGLYPYPGSWQTAGLPQQARALNQPPAVRVVSGRLQHPEQSRQSLISWPSDTLVLAALKLGEEPPHQPVLRYYDASGSGEALPTLPNRLGLQLGNHLNLLEEPLEPGLPRPYGIYTQRLEQA